MRGSQSMKRMWMGGSEPLRGEWEKTEASRRTKKARENYGDGWVSIGNFGDCRDMRVRIRG